MRPELNACFHIILQEGPETVIRQFGHTLRNNYESCQKLGRGLSAHKTGLSPPVTVSY